MLRDEIKTQLSLDFHPDIHMRLMYGNTLPPKDHGNLNPYLHFNPSQRLYYIERALEIIQKYIYSNKAQWIGIVVDKSIWAESTMIYYKSDLFKTEYSYLRGLPGGSKGIRAYHNVVANPHVDLMARLFFQVDRYVQRRFRDKRAKVVYDANPSSKGLDVLTAIKIFRESGHFKSIVKIEESNRETPLLQMADVCCYRVFRHSLMNYRKINDLDFSEDPIMNAWAGKYPLPSFNEHISKEEAAWTMTIRFEIARAAAISARKDLEMHFCSIDEFSNRCLRSVRQKKLSRWHKHFERFRQR
ncbi:MAG: hypothetical protein HC933_08215 [Pleurocapsa sp. SU_196_0]|nr:hypothetical protein [Pleurocapsa sp. SU_196_0]